jgi:hypothetical protein
MKMQAWFLLVCYAAAFQFRSRIKVRRLNDPRAAAGATVQVAVFEEHDEAIPYWFAAFRDGRLSNTRNTTMIHIDAHPDLALPYLPTPPLQLPLSFPSEKQQRSLMTGNDVFIVAAMLYGLVDRFIWVYPDWDLNGPRHIGSDNFHLSKMKVGWFKSTRRPCTCEFSKTKVVCEAIDATGGDEVEIMEGDCNTVNEVEIERISMSMAMRDGMTLAPSQDTPAGSDRDEGTESTEQKHTQRQYILDIDEDFLAVTSFTNPYDAAHGSSGLHLQLNLQLHRLLRRLNLSLIRMIRPVLTRHEEVGMHNSSMHNSSMHNSSMHDSSMHNSSMYRPLTNHDQS